MGATSSDDICSIGDNFPIEKGERAPKREKEEGGEWMGSDGLVIEWVVCWAVSSDWLRSLPVFHVATNCIRN